MNRLSASVGSKAEPSAVAREAEKIRGLILLAFPVSQVPKRPPSRSSAERLYKENCQLCHGEKGLADTPTAERLDPKPRNFQDPEVNNW